MNRFRYLFKAIFVFIPIYVIFTIIIVNNLPRSKQKIILPICLALGILGCVNNYSAVWVTNDLFTTHKDMTISEKISTAAEDVEQSEMDIKNYRSVCVFEASGYKGAADNYFETLTRNLPTSINAFSLSGYEVSVSESRLDQFSHIMDPEDVFTSYANASYAEFFLENLDECPDKLERELVSNSVKYIIVPNSNIIEIAEFSDEIVEGLNALDGIEVIRTGSFNENYDFIEISGVNSICTDENGIPVAFTDERMDLLSAEINGINELRFSLAYDEGLTAYSVDASGGKSALAISETDNGNIAIDVSGADGQTVCLSYSKRIYPIAFAFEIAVTVLFAANIAAVLLLKNRDEVNK